MAQLSWYLSRVEIVELGDILIDLGELLSVLDVQHKEVLRSVNLNNCITQAFNDTR